MADYWIKWYHEIIDDPKMATLPDRLWRRFSELCLLAGKLGGNEKSGVLPDTMQIAWMLRMNTDDLQLDLIQLSRVDLVEAIPNGWVIPKFHERQSAVPGAERVRQHRERKQKQQYNGDVTTEKRFVTQKTEEEQNRTEGAQPPTPCDPFEALQQTMESQGIVLTGEKDIHSVSELVRLGATPADVLAGIEWKAGRNQGKTIRFVSEIAGPTKTALAQRLQNSGAGKQTYAEVY